LLPAKHTTVKLGTVEGEVDTTSFEFRAIEEVRKFDFVSVKSHSRWILCQVDEVTKKPEGETLAHASIIGYRDKGLTRAPRTVIEPDSIVYKADQDLISETLGLEDAGLNIGTLETDDEIEIFVDQEDFYKHFSVIGQTGSGKSYATGVLIEEMLEQDLPVLIVDPHGEYHSLGERNPEGDDPASYPVKEFSPNTDVNSEAMPLSFSEAEMERDEIMDVVPDSLSSSQMGVLYNAEKRLDDGYSMDELMDSVRKEDSSARWNLLNSLEQLQDTEPVLGVADGARETGGARHRLRGEPEGRGAGGSGDNGLLARQAPVRHAEARPHTPVPHGPGGSAQLRTRTVVRQGALQRYPPQDRLGGPEVRTRYRCHIPEACPDRQERALPGQHPVHPEGHQS
jgi:Predicted ATPase